MDFLLVLEKGPPCGMKRITEERGGWRSHTGMPLKLYKNKGDFTENYGFTPSLRLPTGRTSGDFPISNGSIDTDIRKRYPEAPKERILEQRARRIPGREAAEQYFGKNQSSAY